MKVIRLNESPESYKAEYDKANSLDKKCEAVKNALNEVVPGFGNLMGNFDNFFINLFINKFKWEELRPNNTFIEFIRGIISKGQTKLFDNEDVFSNAYNCYARYKFTGDDLKDKNSVLYHADLYKQPESSVEYILNVDNMLSTKYDVENNLKLENIDSKVVASRLNDAGIDYDKIVDMLANENYDDLRKAIIYEQSGAVRDAETVKKIINAFKGSDERQNTKDNNSSLKDLSDRLQSLNKDDLSKLVKNLDIDTVNRLVNSLKAGV